MGVMSRFRRAWRVFALVGLLAPLVSLASAQAIATGSWTATVLSAPAVGATSAALYDVSCSSWSACTAVGEYSTGSAAAAPSSPLVERYNGVRWTPLQVPSARGGDLLSVSCPSQRVCVATGVHVRGRLRGHPLAARWNGSAWSVTQPTRGSGVLFAVSCFSADACTAVGVGQLPGHGHVESLLAVRWNGARWTVERTPSPPGAVLLRGISCRSRTSCVAVGWSDSGTGGTTPLAERWNGVRWQLERTAMLPGSANHQGAVSQLSHVSCSSASSCTAVGTSCAPVTICSPGSYAGPDHPLVERLNGNRWTLQSTASVPGANRGGSLRDVSCPSARICVAVGDFASGLVAERWNGVTWSAETTPSIQPTPVLSSISCPSRARCIAAGTAYDVHAPQTQLLIEQGP
jgi:hypothetical protein